MRNSPSRSPRSAQALAHSTREASLPGGSCTAVIGSMTQAMRAQALLSEAAIRAGITKVSSARTHNGCAYGVEFPCTQSANVRAVLERAGVRVREYLS
jgi:hypothetical protein